MVPIAGKTLWKNNISGFKIISIATLQNEAEEEVSNNFKWFQLLLIECL